MALDNYTVCANSNLPPTLTESLVRSSLFWRRGTVWEGTLRIVSLSSSLLPDSLTSIVSSSQYCSKSVNALCASVLLVGKVVSLMYMYMYTLCVRRCYNTVLVGKVVSLIGVT